MLYTPRAIETLQLALKTTPMNHPSISRCLAKLAKEHQRTFSLDRDPSHIDDALSTLSRALQLTSASHSDFPSHLEGIAGVLMLRFDLTEDVSNLDGAISKLRQAVKATAEENIKLGCRQNSLGQSLYLRFEHNGDLSDLSDSIAAQTKALELSLRRHPYLGLLAKELRRSFQSFLKLLEASLQDEKLLPSPQNAGGVRAPSCGCDSIHLLSTLGALLHLRFQRAGASTDLAAAISIRRLLLRLTSDGYPHYQIFLHDLGSSLQSRFQRYGHLCDIDEAISLFQTSASGQRHNPGCHGGQLDLEDGRRCITHSVASCFRDKYEVTRDRDNLDEAICTLQRMVDRDPDDSTHPCVAAWLRTLASSFSSRFGHTGDIRDISEAISIQERLVLGSGDEHSSRIDSKDFVILSGMLDSRFVEFGDLEDIDRAISLGRRAIQPSSEHFSGLPLAGRLQSLAGLLIDRVLGKVGKMSGLSACQHEAGPREDASLDISDGLVLKYLTEAVVLSRASVELTPSDDPNYPARLDNLANCLHALFDHAKNPHDINEAIDLQVEAIELTPNQYPARKSAYRTQLGELYHCRYFHMRDDEDLAAMISTYEVALRSQFQAPGAKLQAAIRFARHCVDATQIMSAFDAATDAAAMMVGLGQTIRERYSRIYGFSEMPLEAAAVACRSGRPDKALEWLEQGRCLVWSQLNYLRTPLETLRGHDPALATSIADVSKRLEEAGSRRALIEFHMSESDKLSLDDEARDHAKLARRWEELLVEARTLPGFASFLKPLSCTALIDHLPPSGNIIIVTAHKERCDAIALVAGLGEPLHIPLPDLTISKAREYRAILNRKLRAHGFRGQEIYRNKPDEGESGNVERGLGRYRSKDRGVIYVLKALWIEVVKPVLDALDIPVSRMYVS
jgi:tetratricopeptide (TPR) repeat protein